MLLFILPVISAQTLQDEATEIQNIINEEFSDIFENENPQDRLVMIVGIQVSVIERAAAEIIKAQIRFPETIDLVLIKESDEALRIARETSKTIFLIGGPSQNLVTKTLMREGVVQEPDVEKDKFLAVARGTNNAGSKIVVFSDLRGYNNIERESARLSPLANFIPVEYVPAAASIIGVILAFLISFTKKIAGAYLTGMAKKKAQVKEEYAGFKIKHFHVKFREYGAILIAALFFGMAIALSYTGLQSAVIQTFQLTVVVVIVIFAIREGVRLLMAYLMKVHAEYKFWLAGGIISLVSGFLGNTMNTTAFVLEIKDKGSSFEKFAQIKYWVVVLTFLGGIAFFVLNLLNPARVFQMIMASATTLGMAEIIPIQPLQGAAIKKWKPWLWFFTLVIMVVMYILMNFVI